MKCSTWPTRLNAFPTAAGRRNNAALLRGSTGKLHCEKATPNKDSSSRNYPQVLVSIVNLVYYYAEEVKMKGLSTRLFLKCMSDQAWKMADALALVVHSFLSADGDGDAILDAPVSWTESTHFPYP